jgi:hypothetical protein
MVTAMRSTALVLIVLLTASGATAAPMGVEDSQRVYEDVGREPSVIHWVFDAVLLRPFGFAQLAVGVALFVPFYPMSLVADGGEDLFRACVSDPFERTFRRPLGRL